MAQEIGSCFQVNLAQANLAQVKFPDYFQKWGMACVAVLKSRCGEWHFFDLAALQVATTSVAMMGVNSGESTHVVENHAFVGDAERTAHLPQDRRVELLGGFSIEQWASYAKRKAHIATTICKENGALKSKLKAHGPELHMSSVADPCQTLYGLFERDPWHAASMNLAHTGGSIVSTFKNNGSEAWSNWHGASEVATVQGFNDLDANDSAERSFHAKTSGCETGCNNMQSAPRGDNKLEDAVEQYARENSGNASVERSDMVDNVVAASEFMTATEKCIKEAASRNSSRMDVFYEQIRAEFLTKQNEENEGASYCGTVLLPPRS